MCPKDKKSKEEKTTELGHLTFDLLPLVCGERSIQLSSSLQGGGGGSEGGGGGGSEGGVGEVDVEVKTSQDFLSDEQLDERFVNIQSNVKLGVLISVLRNGESCY